LLQCNVLLEKQQGSGAAVTNNIHNHAYATQQLGEHEQKRAQGVDPQGMFLIHAEPTGLTGSTDIDIDIDRYRYRYCRTTLEVLCLCTDYSKLFQQQKGAFTNLGR